MRKKQEEIEEAERAKRSKVMITFDLVGRKVVLLPYCLVLIDQSFSRSFFVTFSCGISSGQDFLCTVDGFTFSDK